MTDFKLETRCPVFCIADIPTSTLNHFLQCTEEYLEENEIPTYEVHTADRIVIIDTKDISSIANGSSPPVDLPPTAFVGHTVQEVRDWFDANPRPKGFMLHCFLVFDSQSIEDDTCLFVGTQDGTQDTPLPMPLLRCDFDVALLNAMICEHGQSIEEVSMGSFMRSGVVMTKENLKLADSGGL